MAPSYPSIQSFFEREVQAQAQAQAQASSPAAPPTTKSPSKLGDGFTEEELTEALDPMSRKWNPDREYEECTIRYLVPGPKAVTFMGRVVNFNTVFGKTAKQPKAAGWHYLTIKDDTGAIYLKLYFANRSFPLKLGQLLSIWTAFISDTSKAETTPIAPVATMANLFPGRNTADHVMIHTHQGTEAVCRVPLEYEKGQSLPGLMTLESYIGGGHDGVVGAKILVCLKSIGAKKRITRKDGTPSDLMDVLLFDHTGDIKCKIWSGLIESAKEWQPGKTILLISNPTYKMDFGNKGMLFVGRMTTIEVDPDFPDADWLRKHAVGLTKKESLCLEIPEGVFDVDDAIYGANTGLFKLADIDVWIRENPSNIFTGWMNVTVMEMALVQNHRRNMLMCTECCGIPIYTNALTITCPHCSTHLTLKLNPKIIGTLVDESGCISTGKLVWSDKAWEELLGRPVNEIVEMSIDEHKLLEQRMCYMRMHLVFGWEEGMGRLCVLGMRP